jgi:hypothetical protein
MPEFSLGPNFPSDPCDRCGHEFNPHILMAVVFGPIGEVEDVPLGGHMFCQEPDCMCYMTWGLEAGIVGYEVRDKIGPPPTPELIARLRASTIGSEERKEVLKEIPRYPKDHQIRFKENGEKLANHD